MKQDSSHENGAFERRKSIIGIRMTVLYALVYGGFMALSVFQSTLMGTPVFLGLNLAMAYGLSLIFIAIVFALVYNLLCRIPPPSNTPIKPKKPGKIPADRRGQ